MYVFSAKEILQNLIYKKGIEIMQECFEGLGHKLVGMTSKYALPLPALGSLLGVMTGHQVNGRFAVIKSIALSQENSHQGIISLYDYKNGELLAIFDASSITAIRTACVSALASKYLAHANAKTLSVIGAGEQSFHHVLAHLEVKKIARINVFNRTYSKSESLKKRLIDKGITIPIYTYPLRMMKDIIESDDIIIIATSSPSAIITRDELPESCHINSIGSCHLEISEVSSDIVNTARLVVDDKMISTYEAGNLINTEPKRVYELKDIVVKPPGYHKGISLFNSTGLGIQDLYCCIYLYKNYKGLASVNLDFGVTHA